MAITGHKTRAMFDRYNIVNESDLTEAAARMEQFRSAEMCRQGTTSRPD
jgi:hypothetical protein